MKFNRISRRQENLSTRLKREMKLIRQDKIKYNPAYYRALLNM